MDPQRGARRAERSIRGLCDTLEKEGEPCFPVSLEPRQIEEPVVLVAVLLEKQAQIEERLPEHSVVAEQQRDQQAADAAVPVQERMDRLELRVGEPGPDEMRQALAIVVNEMLESGDTLRHLGVRRRHIVRVARPRAADPILRTSELPGILVAPTPALEQLAVHFADEARTDRRAAPQARETVLERRHIPAHLDNVVDRRPRCLLDLEEQEIGERRLGPLDLRRKHGLLAVSYTHLTL